MNKLPLLLLVFILSISCQEDSDLIATENELYQAVSATFGTTIDLQNLAIYANQPIPAYIVKNNTNGNSITNEVATLGRVLFYDKNLSSNSTISCASCHQQENAFSDTAIASQGVNGATGRHSMRLINTRFATETKFFWAGGLPFKKKRLQYHFCQL